MMMMMMICVFVAGWRLDLRSEWPFIIIIIIIMMMMMMMMVMMMMMMMMI